MKIKIFADYSFPRLEKHVNEFLKTHNVINILQSENDDGVTITLVYKE